MIVNRVIKRLEEAFREHNKFKLASVSRDLGDEIVRRRTEVLNNFLVGASLVKSTLLPTMTSEEVLYLTALTDLVNSAVARLYKEEDDRFLKIVYSNHHSIFDALSKKRMTATELAEVLKKDVEAVKAALAKLEILQLAGQFGLKGYWELTGHGLTLVDD